MSEYEESPQDYQLGTYRIPRDVKPLRGSMGLVYEGRDDNDERVALKTFQVADTASESEWEFLRSSLLKEGRRAATLDHPNIVRIREVVDEESLAFVVMDWVEGQTLEELLASGPQFDEDTSMDVLTQTAHGLDHAHDHGLIHRDVKPQNLIWNVAQRKLTVLDFGIAKTTGGRSIEFTKFQPGTPEYMAPEQILNVQPLPKEVDQWALGIIAYRMLTGNKPFRAQDVAGLQMQIVKTSPPEPSKVRRSLPKQVDKVFARVLSKDHTRRYPSCSDFVRELGKALDGVGAESNSNFPLLALAVALALGVLLFAGYKMISIPGAAPIKPAAKKEIAKLDTPGVVLFPPQVGNSVQTGAVTVPDIQPPPPPPPPQVIEPLKVYLRVFSRDRVIPDGGRFPLNDENLGYINLGGLTARVSVASGRLAAGESLELVWAINNIEYETVALTAATLKTPKALKIRPTDGEYSIVVKHKGDPVATHQFTILPENNLESK